VDGTCVALFTGCNEPSDFPFSTQGAALVASQALLDQVLIDGPSGDFDSNPFLTFGCPGFAPICSVVSPYFADALTAVVSTASNAPNGIIDLVSSGFGLSPTFDLSLSGYQVFAQWTPAAVPEPAFLTLLGLGLAGMGARRWRQRKP
jgi:hypothetical protein